MPRRRPFTDISPSSDRGTVEGVGGRWRYGGRRGFDYDALDYRVSIPWLGGPGVYLVVLAGRERRSPRRLEDNQQDRRSVLVPSAFAVLAGAGVFGLLILVYVAQSLLGLEVSLRDSLLNPLMDIFS